MRVEHSIWAAPAASAEKPQAHHREADEKARHDEVDVARDHERQDPEAKRDERKQVLDAKRDVHSVMSFAGSESDCRETVARLKGWLR